MHGIYKLLIHSSVLELVFYENPQVQVCTEGTRIKTTLNIKHRPLGMKKAVFWNRLTAKYDISESEPDSLLVSPSKHDKG